MLEAWPVVPPDVTATRERITWEEIRRRYPDQWVVCIETDWIAQHIFPFRSTRVVGHGTDRKTVLAETRPIVAQHMGFGCFFTGRIRAPVRTYLAP
jgi:hypothetical protein